METHILSSITLLESGAIYDILRKNIVELGRPQNTIWRMRIECWTRKATHTCCVILLVHCNKACTKLPH